jgi:hypothetical protein
MPIRVELRTERGEVVRGLVDPGGGMFDAAGHFDRHLFGDARVGVAGATFRLFQYVDPYGDTMFNALQMDDLLSDIEVARGRTSDELECRGLDRLRLIAETCRDSTHLYVWFVGD